jgi:pimeloyl-ACP methyl ester carboxylesterase
MTERPITFRDGQGQRLFGILHLPASSADASKIGVNILNPGLKGRVAPNRINVRIARMLCARGFPVLRFDPHGIGDSEGCLAQGNELNLDLWGMIQRGALVPDTLAANDFFVREARVERLVLLGQCGAAVTALLAAPGDRRVGGAILVDLPVRLVSSKLDMADLWMEVRSPDEMIREYLAKVLDRRSWANLIRMRSDFSKVRQLLSRKVRSSLGRGRPAAGAAPGVSSRFLWSAREACDAFRARGGELSFLFAENDFAVKEFGQDMLPALADREGAMPRGVSMHVIKDANHIYTEEHWQRELFGHILHFMSGHSAAIAAGSPAPRSRH